MLRVESTAFLGSYQIFENVGLPPYLLSATVTVAECKKPLATTVDLWPLVDH